MNTRSTALHLLGLCTLLISVTALSAADWPQIRGPHRDGIALEKGRYLDWGDDGPELMWSKSLGPGTSSAAISNGRLYTMGFLRGVEIVYCLDPETGKEIWRHEYPSKLEPNLFEGGSRGTPTVDGYIVYTMGHMGTFYALDARDGKVLWKTNLLKQFSSERPEWGLSLSPLIAGNLLIMLSGDSGSLIALDKQTGKTIWEQRGYTTSYSSVQLDSNRPENAFIFTASGLVYFRIKDGRKLWEYPWKTAYNLNVAIPQVIGDHVFITSGYKHGGTLLKVSTSHAKKVWMTKNFSNHFGGVVLRDNTIYGFHGNTGKRGSFLRSLDVKTGKVNWEQNGLGAGNVILVYDKLIVLSEYGELLLVNINPDDYDEVNRIQILSGKCYSSPAFANGLVYSRNNKGKMVCYRVGTPTN